MAAELNNASLFTVKMPKTMIIPPDLLSYFLVINFWGPGQSVTILGLIVNIINVLTFVKQGVKDSVNISLLGLTISDLGSLLFLFFLNLCWTPAISKLDLPFYPKQVMYFIFWIHVIFTRVTTGITAWIAFERCLCIVYPLKVKSIVTPRRTVMYICALYVIMTATVTPMYITSQFTWISDPVRNKSILGYVKTLNKNRGNIEGVAFLTNNIFPILFFVFIVVCTIILVKALRRNAKWRQQTSSSEKANSLSIRDTKVVKMVFIISLVFIFCYAPGAVFIILPLFDQEIRIDGPQKNLVLALFSLVLHLESINASANFFIYIGMSSKFKATCHQLFCLQHKIKENN